MESEISNFPPTSAIFLPSKNNKHTKKDKLSAISKAELMGGFQPTLTEIIESTRENNPFDYQNSQKSTSKEQSSSSCFDSPKKIRSSYSSDPYFRKKNELRRFISEEFARLINQDHQEYLSAYSRKELNVCGGFPNHRIRKQMLMIGLL
ncbi:hypothetical protein TVAG_010050 [Trichomonas vaginalis G3]|uniref:Uncharacterized protein n=1 Tax=Trichomonas vaginalis (strain ATCC PRA-98 / G3) TaxID=412133 RepID=A2FA22_TRIV3|nr:hypothetical protein TVAGG3_0082650 [Trichomonas vaginalis G3]EAX98230.1 hypothetical protein TVAG_010050 [Trichomonas vaginalis G3]KAI5543371.1 hypothetical protein TVAGG3_0082650 [Trichomonas vaginalis G3]|eukprot:XP_001311160.1 hypothetical protein [Trichomonas vaginalis G3]